MTKQELLDEYVTEEEAARIIGIDSLTLRNRRYAGKNHPPFYQSNKRCPVRYPIKLLRKWMEERTIFQMNKAS